MQMPYLELAIFTYVRTDNAITSVFHIQMNLIQRRMEEVREIQAEGALPKRRVNHVVVSLVVAQLWNLVANGPFEKQRASFLFSNKVFPRSRSVTKKEEVVNIDVTIGLVTGSGFDVGGNEATRTNGWQRP